MGNTKKGDGETLRSIMDKNNKKLYQDVSYVILVVNLEDQTSIH